MNFSVVLFQRLMIFTFAAQVLTPVLSLADSDRKHTYRLRGSLSEQSQQQLKHMYDEKTWRNKAPTILKSGSQHRSRLAESIWQLTNHEISVLEFCGNMSSTLVGVLEFAHNFNFPAQNTVRQPLENLTKIMTTTTKSIQKHCQNLSRATYGLVKEAHEVVWIFDDIEKIINARLKNRRYEYLPYLNDSSRDLPNPRP